MMSEPSSSRQNVESAACFPASVLSQAMPAVLQARPLSLVENSQDIHVVIYKQDEDVKEERNAKERSLKRVTSKTHKLSSSRSKPRSAVKRSHAVSESTPAVTNGGNSSACKENVSGRSANSRFLSAGPSREKKGVSCSEAMAAHNRRLLLQVQNVQSLTGTQGLVDELTLRAAVPGVLHQAQNVPKFTASQGLVDELTSRATVEAADGAGPNSLSSTQVTFSTSVSACQQLPGNTHSALTSSSSQLLGLFTEGSQNHAAASTSMSKKQLTTTRAAATVLGKEPSDVVGYVLVEKGLVDQQQIKGIPQTSFTNVSRSPLPTCVGGTFSLASAVSPSGVNLALTSTPVRQSSVSAMCSSDTPVFSAFTSPLQASTPIRQQSGGKPGQMFGTLFANQSVETATPSQNWTVSGHSVESCYVSGAESQLEEMRDSGVGASLESVVQTLAPQGGGLDLDQGTTNSSWATSDNSNHMVIDPPQDSQGSTEDNSLQGEDGEMNTSLTKLNWVVQFALDNKRTSSNSSQLAGSVSGGGPPSRSSKSDSICSCGRVIQKEKKPNHTFKYRQLIEMALLSRADCTMTIREIRAWFIKNFEFFLQHEQCDFWKNAIRHNLSSNDCFMKDKIKKKHWTLDLSLCSARIMQAHVKGNVLPMAMQVNRTSVPRPAVPEAVVSKPLPQPLVLSSPMPNTTPVPLLNTHMNGNSGKLAFPPILPRPVISSQIALLSVNSVLQQQPSLLVQMPVPRERSSGPNTGLALHPLHTVAAAAAVPKLPLPPMSAVGSSVLSNATSSAKKNSTGSKSAGPKVGRVQKRKSTRRGTNTCKEGNLLLQAAIQSGLKQNWGELEASETGASESAVTSAAIFPSVDQAVTKDSYSNGGSDSCTRSSLVRSQSLPPILSKRAKATCPSAAQSHPVSTTKTSSQQSHVYGRGRRKQNFPLATVGSSDVVFSGSASENGAGASSSKLLFLTSSSEKAEDNALNVLEPQDAHAQLFPLMTPPRNNPKLSQTLMESPSSGTPLTLDTSTPIANYKVRMEPLPSPIRDAPLSDMNLTSTNRSLMDMLGGISILSHGTLPEESPNGKSAQSTEKNQSADINSGNLPGLMTPPSSLLKTSQYWSMKGFGDSSLDLLGASGNMDLGISSFSNLMEQLPDDLSLMDHSPSRNKSTNSSNQRHHSADTDLPPQDSHKYSAAQQASVDQHNLHQLSTKQEICNDQRNIPQYSPVENQQCSRQQIGLLQESSNMQQYSTVQETGKNQQSRMKHSHTDQGSGQYCSVVQKASSDQSREVQQAKETQDNKQWYSTVQQVSIGQCSNSQLQIIQPDDSDQQRRQPTSSVQHSRQPTSSVQHSRQPTSSVQHSRQRFQAIQQGSLDQPSKQTTCTTQQTNNEQYSIQYHSTMQQASIGHNSKQQCWTVEQDSSNHQVSAVEQSNIAVQRIKEIRNSEQQANFDVCSNQIYSSVQKSNERRYAVQTDSPSQHYNMASPVNSEHQNTQQCSKIQQDCSDQQKAQDIAAQTNSCSFGAEFTALLQSEVDLRKQGYAEVQHVDPDQCSRQSEATLCSSSDQHNIQHSKAAQTTSSDQDITQQCGALQQGRKDWCSKQQRGAAQITSDQHNKQSGAVLPARNKLRKQQYRAVLQAGGELTESIQQRVINQRETLQHFSRDFADHDHDHQQHIALQQARDVQLSRQQQQQQTSFNQSRQHGASQQISSFQCEQYGTGQQTSSHQLNKQFEAVPQAGNPYHKQFEAVPQAGNPYHKQSGTVHKQCEGLRQTSSDHGGEHQNRRVNQTSSDHGGEHQNRRVNQTSSDQHQQRGVAQQTNTEQQCKTWPASEDLHPVPRPHSASPSGGLWNTQQQYQTVSDKRLLWRSYSSDQPSRSRLSRSLFPHSVLNEISDSQTSSNLICAPVSEPSQCTPFSQSVKSEGSQQSCLVQLSQLQRQAPVSQCRSSQAQQAQMSQSEQSQFTLSTELAQFTDHTWSGQQSQSQFTTQARCAQQTQLPQSSSQADQSALLPRQGQFTRQSFIPALAEMDLGKNTQDTCLGPNTQQNLARAGSIQRQPGDVAAQLDSIPNFLTYKTSWQQVFPVPSQYSLESQEFDSGAVSSTSPAVCHYGMILPNNPTTITSCTTSSSQVSLASLQENSNTGPCAHTASMPNDLVLQQASTHEDSDAVPAKGHGGFVVGSGLSEPGDSPCGYGYHLSTGSAPHCSKGSMVSVTQLNQAIASKQEQRASTDNKLSAEPTISDMSFEFPSFSEQPLPITDNFLHQQVGEESTQQAVVGNGAASPDQNISFADYIRFLTQLNGNIPCHNSTPSLQNPVNANKNAGSSACDLMSIPTGSMYMSGDSVSVPEETTDLQQQLAAYSLNVDQNSSLQSEPNHMNDFLQDLLNTPPDKRGPKQEEGHNG